MPHLGVDPIVTGAQIVTALQTIVSRNIPPGEMAVVTIGKFQSGNAYNVIPDKAELAATVRTVTETSRKLIEQRIRDIVDNITKSNGATYKLDYFLSYPAIQNDSALVDFARASASKTVGAAQVFEAPSMTASEDFSYYHNVAPICFINLGIGPGVANHNPKFNPDESAFANGVKVQVQLILDFLRGENYRQVITSRNS